MLDDYKPEEVFMPFIGDIHSDHTVVAKCVESACKTFRSPYIKRVFSYETISETEQSFRSHFVPSMYVNIENELDKKLHALSFYESEIKEFPFPRSIQAVKALAHYRGCSSGFRAAEGFLVNRFIED